MDPWEACLSAGYCPRCVIPMNGGRLGPVALSLCLRCGGIWFPSGGLPAVLGAGARPIWRLVEGIRAARQGGPTYDRAPACPSCSLGLEGKALPLPAGAEGTVKASECSICGGHWTEVETLGVAAASLTAAETQATAPTPARASSPGSEPPVDPAKQEVRAPWAGANRHLSGDPCPGCGSPNPKNSPLCFGCGQLLQGEVEGNCPYCECPLHRFNSQGVALHACGGCGGVLLGTGPLDVLLQQSGVHQEQLVKAMRKVRTSTPRTEHPRLHCRHCRLVMFEAPLGIISTRPAPTCPQCRFLFLERSVIEGLLLGA